MNLSPAALFALRVGMVMAFSKYGDELDTYAVQDVPRGNKYRLSRQVSRRKRWLKKDIGKTEKDLASRLNSHAPTSKFRRIDDDSSHPTFLPSSSSHGPASTSSSSPTIVLESKEPSFQPSWHPIPAPSSMPTQNVLTVEPTKEPSPSPSKQPSHIPTNIATMEPSQYPSKRPSFLPTVSHLTNDPSFLPSISPSGIPTLFPTKITITEEPSQGPSATVTTLSILLELDHVTAAPTTQNDLYFAYDGVIPASQSTSAPSPLESKRPSSSDAPPPALSSHNPSDSSSPSPSAAPSSHRSHTEIPSFAPSISNRPINDTETEIPSRQPSIAPTATSSTGTTSLLPSEIPSFAPSISYGYANDPNLGSFSTSMPSAYPTTYQRPINLPSMSPLMPHALTESPTELSNTSMPSTKHPSKLPTNAPFLYVTTDYPTPTMYSLNPIGSTTFPTEARSDLPLTSNPTSLELSEDLSTFPTSASNTMMPTSQITFGTSPSDNSVTQFPTQISWSSSSSSFPTSVPAWNSPTLSPSDQSSTSHPTTAVSSAAPTNGPTSQPPSPSPTSSTTIISTHQPTLWPSFASVSASISFPIFYNPLSSNNGFTMEPTAVVTRPSGNAPLAETPYPTSDAPTTNEPISYSPTSSPSDVIPSDPPTLFPTYDFEPLPMPTGFFGTDSPTPFGIPAVNEVTIKPTIVVQRPPLPVFNPLPLIQTPFPTPNWYAPANNYYGATPQPTIAVQRPPLPYVNPYPFLATPIPSSTWMSSGNEYNEATMKPTLIIQRPQMPFVNPLPLPQAPSPESESSYNLATQKPTFVVQRPPIPFLQTPFPSPTWFSPGNSYYEATMKPTMMALERPPLPALNPTTFMATPFPSPSWFSPVDSYEGTLKPTLNVQRPPLPYFNPSSYLQTPFPSPGWFTPANSLLFITPKPSMTVQRPTLPAFNPTFLMETSYPTRIDSPPEVLSPSSPSMATTFPSFGGMATSPLNPLVAPYPSQSSPTVPTRSLFPSPVQYGTIETPIDFNSTEYETSILTLSPSPSRDFNRSHFPTYTPPGTSYKIPSSLNISSDLSDEPTFVSQNFSHVGSLEGQHGLSMGPTLSPTSQVTDDGSSESPRWTPYFGKGKSKKTSKSKKKSKSGKSIKDDDRMSSKDDGHGINLDDDDYSSTINGKSGKELSGKSAKNEPLKVAEILSESHKPMNFPIDAGMKLTCGIASLVTTVCTIYFLSF